MLTKRIIPCLDIDQGRVVKGVNFINIKDAGDQVATRNITVNVIAPGYVSTATTNVLSEKVKKEVMSWIPRWDKIL